MPSPDPFSTLGFAGHSDRIARGIVKLLLADSALSTFFAGQIVRTKSLSREDLLQPDRQPPFLFVYPGVYEPTSRVGGTDTIRRFPIVAVVEDNRLELGDGYSAASLVEYIDYLLKANNTLQFADLFSNKPLAAVYYGFDTVLPAPGTIDRNGTISTVMLQLMVARYEYETLPATGQPYGFTATEF